MTRTLLAITLLAAGCTDSPKTINPADCKDTVTSMTTEDATGKVALGGVFVEAFPILRLTDSNRTTLEAKCEVPGNSNVATCDLVAMQIPAGTYAVEFRELCKSLNIDDDGMGVTVSGDVPTTLVVH